MMGRTMDHGLPHKLGGRVCGTPVTSYTESGPGKLVPWGRLGPGGGCRFGYDLTTLGGSSCQLGGESDIDADSLHLFF